MSLLDSNVAKKKNLEPPCCPELDATPRSDVLDFHYRQVYDTRQSIDGNPVQVEVIVRTSLERKTGPYALGDLIYTNTLLPGEDVFLFASDRRARFAFDATTNITYRAENTLEDDFYLSSMSDFLADVTVKDEGQATNKTKGSLEGHTDSSSALESLFGGPSADMKGSFNAESTLDFMNELTAHAKASDHRSVAATHTASAISIGSVGTRQHAEGQAQDTFEASFRHFRNPNRCHAITFYFYRINKTQTVSFTIEAIDRRVIDPANETKVTNNAFIPKGGVTLVSSGVLATAQNRAEVETIGRTASTSHILRPTNEIAALTAAARTAPIPGDVRARAVREVEQQLIRVGLLAPNGEISEETKRRHSFTRTSHLPTPGFFVRSCRDECDVCEPSLLRSIDLCLTSTIDRCCSLKPPCLADLKDRISSAYDWVRNSLTGIFWPPASSSPPQAPSSP